MFQFSQKAAGLLRLGAVATALTLGTLLASPASAQSRAETLVVVSEEGPATLDIHGPTANVPTHEVSWNVYDRLISHARIKQPDGSLPTTTRPSRPNSRKAGK